MKESRTKSMDKVEFCEDPKSRFRFWKESFQILFFEMHYILMVTFFTLLTFIPVITAGGGVIALSCSLRAICENRRVTPKEYFRFFKQNFLKGLWYDLSMLALWGLTYFEFLNRGAFLAYVFGVVFLLFFTLYYPNVCYSEKKFLVCMKKSICYLTAHIYQALIIISFGYVLLVAIMAISQFLLILFYPIWLFAIVRAVEGNNRRIDAKRALQNIEENTETFEPVKRNGAL